MVLAIPGRSLAGSGDIVGDAAFSPADTPVEAMHSRRSVAHGLRMSEGVRRTCTLCPPTF